VKQSLLAIAILALLFLLPGCSPSVQQQEDDNTNYEILSAERLVKRLEANRRKIRNFRGNGDMEIVTPNFDNGASFRVSVSRPDSLLLSIYGPFKIELVHSLVAKKDFIFYDVINNTAYKGNVDDDVLAEMFKINLTFSELNDAFIGAVDLSEQLYKQPDSYQVNETEYILSYKNPDTKVTTTYNVSIKDLMVTSYTTKDAQGNLRIVAEYSDFKVVDGSVYPHQITIRYLSDAQQISIKYDKLEVNKPNIIVDFKLPSGVDVISW